MEDYILIRPTTDYAAQIAEYRKEFLDADNAMDGCGPLRCIENPNKYIKLCKEYEDPETVPPHLVTATQFIFVRKSDDRLLGMIQIRHYFNEYLEKFGGHIGYSIRPSERRKGYAKKMLGAVIPFCKEIGLEKVLVTCNDGNIGSEKTIVYNGGIYESTIYDPAEDANLKRYWISM